MSTSEIYITIQKIDNLGQIEKRQILWNKIPEQYKMAVNSKRRLYFYDNGEKKEVITEEKFKELVKLFNPKPRFKFLRFIAAWIVMVLISMALCFVGAFLTSLIITLLENFINNSILKTIAYLVLSPVLIATTFNPMLLASNSAILVSNKILESPKGIRYIVYGIYLFIFNLLALTTDIIITQNVIATVFAMIYGLLIIYARCIHYSE